MSLDATVVWAGGGLDPLARARHEAVSPAAQQWQLRLITALAKRSPSLDIHVVAAMPAPAWPRGPIAPRIQPTDVWPDHRVWPLSYWNAPVVRHRSQSRSLSAVVAEISPPRDRPVFLLTYNVYPFYGKAVREIRRRYPTVRWVPIIADLVGGSPAKLLRWMEGAHGAVVLSQYAHDYVARFLPTLHLPGGVDAITPKDMDESRPIVYAGSRGADAGFPLLLQAARLRTQQVPIWIFGPGGQLAKRGFGDGVTGIVDLGLVGEDRLDDLCSRAAAFVNPRPENLNSRFSFPSKLLLYLRYGRPVISTDTVSLPHDYREKLRLVQPGSAEGLARAMDEAAAGDLQPPEASWIRQHSWCDAGRGLSDFLLREFLE